MKKRASFPENKRGAVFCRHQCHAKWYLWPNVTQYEELIRRLAIGDSANNNAVIYKIANIRSIAPDRPNHPGGQRCANIDAEPCKSIRQWWEIEFGTKGTNKTPPVATGCHTVQYLNANLERRS